jgi:hypothetical protein
MEPRSAYLELDAHPPRATPYTAMDESAMKKRSPTFRSATWSGISRPNRVTGAPKGITAKVRMAGIAAMAGAR